MISKRHNCRDLLDKLIFISENYSINNGIIIDNNGEEIKNENIITRIKFYVLYSLAYKNLIESIDNIKIDNMSKQYANSVLLNSGVFNSFINNCISEYNMYGKIGTGYISYIPYSPLADYIFENEERKAIVYDYLNIEMQEYIDCQQKVAKKTK